LAPNCICRIACAEVILPKFAVPNVALGLLKFARLKRLNASARI